MRSQTCEDELGETAHFHSPAVIQVTSQRTAYQTLSNVILRVDSAIENVLAMHWFPLAADVLREPAQRPERSYPVTVGRGLTWSGSKRLPKRALRLSAGRFFSGSEPKMFIASLCEREPMMERNKVCEETRPRGTGSEGTLFPIIELTKSMTFHSDAKEIEM